jgi:tRNA pseudouridine32 synthase/23S rRNA pseudouridine746 synthase
MPQTLYGLNNSPASRLQQPPGPWTTVLQALCAQFPAIDAGTWTDRFARGRVLNADGLPLAVDAPYRLGATIHYFREVVDEPVIPYAETIVHSDAHLVVACKPHFLPVVPAGVYVRQTLLARLVETLDNPQLVPLHRIDRDTAGLVLFSANPASRGAYRRCSASAASPSTTWPWPRLWRNWNFRTCTAAGWCRASRSSACARWLASPTARR